MKTLNFSKLLLIGSASFLTMIFNQACTPEIPLAEKPNIEVSVPSNHYCDGNVSYSVKNTGHTNIAGFYMRLSTYTGVVLENQLVVNLAPNETRSFVYVTDKASVPNSITITADQENYVNEATESDNVIRVFRICVY